MAVYDFDGAVCRELKAIYDHDGVAAHQIGKGYDFDGAAARLVYQSALTLTNYFSQAPTYDNGAYYSRAADAGYRSDGHYFLGSRRYYAGHKYFIRAVFETWGYLENADLRLYMGPYTNLVASGVGDHKVLWTPKSTQTVGMLFNYLGNTVAGASAGWKGWGYICVDATELCAELGLTTAAQVWKAIGSRNRYGGFEVET